MAQTTRRWLWRLNGVMALVALTAWGWALLGPHDDAPPIRIEPSERPQEPAPWRASAHWAEITAQAQPWLGRPPVAGSTKQPPRAPAVTPGRLPLASFEVTCHIQDASGPDLVFLKSKDPAHPETYMPEEDEADGDVAIERIAYEPRVTKITVRRGEERFTYDFVGNESVSSLGLQELQRAKPSGRHDDALPSTADLLASDDVPQVEVKLVPFYSPRGELMGGRVTGVRPGCRLKVAGLKPGDVVVGVDGGFVSSVDRLRMQLRSNEGVREISILRGTEGPKRSLALGG